MLKKPSLHAVMRRNFAYAAPVTFSTLNAMADSIGRRSPCFTWTNNWVLTADHGAFGGSCASGSRSVESPAYSLLERALERSGISVTPDCCARSGSSCCLGSGETANRVNDPPVAILLRSVVVKLVKWTSLQAAAGWRRAFPRSSVS